MKRVRRWSVDVIVVDERAAFARFTAGVQSFEIARVTDDVEAETHCALMAFSFVHALASLGTPGARAKLKPAAARLEKARRAFERRDKEHRP